MSIRALETLRDADLLDKHGRVADAMALEPAELRRRLNYYYGARTSEANADAERPIGDPNSLNGLVSTVCAGGSVQAVLPSCFVYSQLYVNDPLIRLARPEDGSAHAYNQSLGLKMEATPDPKSVAEALAYFERLSPLIRIGALTVLPIEELHSPPSEGVPIFYSEDWFRSQVPERIHDFVHAHAIIHEVTRGVDGKGLRVLPHPPEAPTRGISVRFADDSQNVRAPFYLLAETEVVERFDESRFRVAQRVDWENPPSRELFDAWVYQSVNRTIINRIQDISREIALARSLRASYLTESRFEALLCGMTFGSSATESSRANAVNFLNANAPYLRINDPALLAKLRTDDPRLFDRWQRALLAISYELGGLGEDFGERAMQLFERDVQPQIDELNNALDRLCAQIGGAGLVAAGAIGMALLSDAGLPFAAVLGFSAMAMGGQALPSVAEYLAKWNTPAFIWNRLAN